MDFLDRIIQENIDNEVRYIDTSYAHKKNYEDAWNQEPIKNDETIRVFHGCGLGTAMRFAIEGIDGKEWHPRRFAYERNMNPIGLFVTTSFETAKEFGNAYNDTPEDRSHNAAVIIEFSAKARDLDSPVWNGQDTFFGQNSNPQPFHDPTERNAQKAEYQKNAKMHKYSYVRDSDNAAMAKNIFDNVEHQALFLGRLNPNMIKRFWVMTYNNLNPTDKSFRPMSRKEFIKQYKNDRFKRGTYDSYHKPYTTKVFYPNDDFTSIEDMVKRDCELHGWKFRQSDVDYFKDALERDDKRVYDELNQMLWHKQLRQLVGDEKYRELIDSWERDLEGL